MKSKHEELRNRLLDADPDGIEMKIEAPTQPRKGGRLNWLDAMLSLLMELEGFKRLFAQRMRVHTHRLRTAANTVNGHDVTAAALTEILSELAQHRNDLIHGGLNALRELGVPSEQLVPQLVGQDWAESSLTDAGVLDMRARFYMVKSPHVAVALERRVRILLPRESRVVRVVS